MQDFFPESLGQRPGCVLYTEEYYTWQNMIFQISYFAPPSLTQFYLLLSSSYFHFKFFLSCWDLFPFDTLTISPHPASQNHFSCHWSSHILFLILKIPLFSLSTLISLCLLVVDVFSILWLLFHFFILSIGLHYFGISNLKFTVPLYYTFCPPPVFLSFFIVSNFNFSQS